MHPSLFDKLRAAAGRYLTGRCIIERETTITGLYGETIRTWAAVGLGVPCRVVNARRSDLDATAITAGRETMERVYRVALPHGTNLNPDDRIVIDGVTYTVVRLETGLTGRVFVQAIVKRR